jgi:hypothetical protein
VAVTCDCDDLEYQRPYTLTPQTSKKTVFSKRNTVVKDL